MEKTFIEEMIENQKMINDALRKLNQVLERMETSQREVIRMLSVVVKSGGNLSSALTMTRDFIDLNQKVVNHTETNWAKKPQVLTK